MVSRERECKVSRYTFSIKHMQENAIGEAILQLADACISCRHLTLRNTEVPGADPPHVRSCSQVHAQAPCLRRLLGTNTLANVMQLSKAKHLQPRRAALAHKQSRQAGAKNRKNSDAVAATIASWGGKGGLTGRC